MNTARRGTVVAALALSAALFGCGGDDESASGNADSAQQSPQGSNSAGDRQPGGGEAVDVLTENTDSAAQPSPSEGAANGQQPGQQPGQQLGLDDTAPLLAIDATVGLAVDDIGAAVPDVVALADKFGGRVYDSDVDLGTGTIDAEGNPVAPDPSEVGGSLTIKVPPAQVEEMIVALADIGTIVSRTQATEDVTDQVVDLDARILTAQASVNNVRELLDEATDLNQIVFLETELTNRQTRLEQLVAQRDGLTDRAALATLTVVLEQRVTTEAPPVTEPPKPEEETGVGEAFSDGWDGFTKALKAVLVFVGYTAPFLVIGGLILFGVWRFSRDRRGSAMDRPGRRSRSAAPPPPPVPGGGPQTSRPSPESPASIP